jgi:ribose-phosphate pyrophosphokinase
MREAVLVSPDTGRVKVVEKYANLLDVPLVVMHNCLVGGNTLK